MSGVASLGIETAREIMALGYARICARIEARVGQSRLELAQIFAREGVISGGICFFPDGAPNSAVVFEFS